MIKQKNRQIFNPIRNEFNEYIVLMFHLVNGICHDDIYFIHDKDEPMILKGNNFFFDVEIFVRIFLLQKRNRNR